MIKPKIKDFFSNGKHVCRFCGTPLRDEKMRPLGCLSYLSIKMEDGGLFVINGCTDCLRQVGPEDYKEICEHDEVMSNDRKPCCKTKAKPMSEDDKRMGRF